MVSHGCCLWPLKLLNEAAAFAVCWGVHLKAEQSQGVNGTESTTILRKLPDCARKAGALSTWMLTHLVTTFSHSTRTLTNYIQASPAVDGAVFARIPAFAGWDSRLFAPSVTVCSSA
jgi:hypothetical protein